jgi:hypothetical protein
VLSDTLDEKDIVDSLAGGVGHSEMFSKVFFERPSEE